jgi:multiple sugar transport system ATP-binding protein
MARFSKEEIAQRVAAAAKTLQIDDLLKRKPAQLSGGQRQRVAIGRAIVRDPGVFLFDEPLSNLDAELRVSMRVEIAKLHQRLGSTMIYVTHDQTEAMTLADKIIVMRLGNIEQAGTPQELYDDPANIFVAGFIGSPRMNFIPAKVRSGSASYSGGKRPMTFPGTADQDILIGVRPEHFRVGAGDAAIELKVDVVEYLGGTRYLYGGLEDGTQLVVEARDSFSGKAGEVVPLHFDGSRTIFFDNDGHRLRDLK